MTVSDKPTTLKRSSQRAADLQHRLESIYRLVAPSWPLAHAVACNPLQGLESLPFSEAVKEGQRLFDGDCLPGLWQLRQAKKNGRLREQDFSTALKAATAGSPPQVPLGKQQVDMPLLLSTLLRSFDDSPGAEADSSLLARAYTHMSRNAPWRATFPAINQRCITWLAAFLDEGQAAWSMPYRERGFFPAVKALLKHDPAHAKYGNLLRSLPDDSLEAIRELLDHLALPGGQQEDFLRDHLLALPGWSSFIRWRSEQEDYEPQQQHPINLTDYLALRLLFARLLTKKEWDSTTPAPRVLRRLSAWAEGFLQPDPSVSSRQWARLLTILQDCYHRLRLELLQSWEQDFRRQLSTALKSQISTTAPGKRPHAQLAFCIDVRSEPFRRQVEAAGDYETFGFAGFFGLPIAYETLLGERVKSLPVLLQPAHELRERAGAGCEHHETRHQRGRQLIKDLKQAYKSLKYNLATPFAAVEALGLPAGLVTAGRSLLPEALIRLRRRGRALFSPHVDLVPDIHPNGDRGIPLDNQVAYAGNALRMMGLTRNFAPLVVLCGHGSQTENNPYAAALDCGACGGSHGGPNAAAMARIFNNPEVRERLREEGIDIPADTLFFGAQHNTTTDEVCLLDVPALEKEKQQQLDELQAELQKAQQSNLAARARQFGRKDARGMLRRSSDWSEVRPEWGLAGNAGFVVGPRHLTRNLDLRGRCFLHSYDWKQDPEGTSLEVILTAPLVVAQWINSQYFFSTTDNIAFGSGNKITHNVVGKIGVMQGNGSDLMHGLPLQSVMKSDTELYHQPLRLTAMVVAPRQRVQQLIEKHDILQQMFFNEWVILQVWDPVQEVMWRLTPTGEWEKQEI